MTIEQAARQAELITTLLREDRETGERAHNFDLEGWCYTHRNYCNMAADVQPFD